MVIPEDEKRKYIKEYSEIALNDDVLGGDASSELLNNFVREHRAHFCKTPRKIYKYRRFDENNYTFEAIANNRFYLTSANSFDDPFEAYIASGFSMIEGTSLFDELFLYYVRSIFEHYNIDFSPIESFYYESKKHEGGLSNFLEKLNTYLVDDLGIELEVFGRITLLLVRFNTDEYMKMIDEKMSFLRGFRSYIGICSLTTNKSSQIMWEYYADHYQGCCIEYSIEDDDYHNLIDLLPVVYQKNRDKTVLQITIDYILDEIFYGIEVAQKNFSWNLFLSSTTKDPEWTFQEEWRIIGLTGYSSHLAPKISAIYLGHRITKKNRKKIVRMARERGIPLYTTRISLEKNVISFEELKY